MNTELSTLMSELREDHRNMAEVLDLLDRVIDDIRNENDDVLELLGEIMHYMTVYPDAVHHPKEDLVYGQLQQHRPDLASGVENVAEDHRDIAELGVQLRSDIDAIESGTAVRRQQLIDDAASYVQRLRNHMQWEEADLFPRIDRMLESTAHPIDLSEFRAMQDPVFGTSSQAGFRRLMASLQT